MNEIETDDETVVDDEMSEIETDDETVVDDDLSYLLLEVEMAPLELTASEVAEALVDELLVEWARRVWLEENNALTTSFELLKKVASCNVDIKVWLRFYH
jgi:uncharacterized Zn finger protein